MFDIAIKIIYITLSLSQQSPSEIHSFPREKESAGFIEKTKTYYRGLSKAVPPKPACEVLPNVNQVIRIVPMKTVPDNAFAEGNLLFRMLLKYSEIIG